MDITNVTITRLDPPTSTTRGTVIGLLDTHDSRGRKARLQFMYVPFHSGYQSTVDTATESGDDLVANDIFDYSEEEFGYVPGRWDPAKMCHVETDHLLFLERDYNAFEKELRRRCDDALAAAEEAARDAFINVLTNELVR